MTDAWFSASRLHDQARAPDRAQAGGDFASYAAALHTGSIVGTAVESHNLIAAAGRVRQYRSLLPRRTYRAIADIGSGLGFTAAALAHEFAGTRVVGYEVSPDAVAFAERHLRGPVYICQAIDLNTKFGESFDLILCQEFYPFTRTEDWAVHKPFLDLFLRHLRPGGVMLIELSERHADASILVNQAQLKPYRPRYRRLAFDRIYRNLQVFWLSSLASAMAAPLFGTARNIAVLIENQPDLIGS